MKKKLSLLLTLLLCFVVGAWADDYALYSGAITEGDYVIYYDGKAMNATVDKNRLQYAEVTPTDGVIANPDAAIIWTIAKSGDYYTLYNASAAKYAAATGTKNQAGLLDDATDDKALWTATGTDTYDFVNKANAAASVNATLRNNGTYGFACYAAGTGGALTLYKKVAAGTVAKPTISGTTPFYGSTQVTLTCATEDASVYYTLDGTEPTASSTPYAEAITLTATTTVKAIAKKGDDVSDVAEKTFTLGTSAATLAEMNAFANNTKFMYTGELLATYVNGAYCYVKDDTGVSLLYQNIPDGVVTGKTINANWTGTVSIYQSLFEVKPDAGQLSAKDGDPVAVTYDKVESVTAADVNKIVVLQGVKAYTAFGTSGDARAFTITLKDDSELAGYNRLMGATEASDAGETYDITGAVAVNGETVQFWPISISKCYAVNVADEITGGTVTAAPTSASAGTEVTLTATPAEGYKLLKYIVKNGEEDVAVSGGKFTMPEGNVTVSAVFVQPEDITIAATDITDGDITAALTAALTNKIAKSITLNLAKEVAYTLKSTIKAPAVTINGNGAVIDASEGDNIVGIEGVDEFAKKADDTDSDHSFVKAITFKDVTINGMKKALIRDLMTKTLLETLTIENCVMQASDGKPFIDFDGRGYVGKVVVKNSTIWAAAGTNKNFAKYGSRPKNVNEALTQEFDIQNSTIVNIAPNADFSGGQNFNNLKQNGTAQNVYTVKNNIFVNSGKSGQAIVGLNNGQTSATPVWAVDGNAFNWNGADVCATEVSKAGQKDGVDIVKNNIPGIVAFANADYATTGNFKLANCAQNTAHIGDPRWLDATVEPAAEDIEISPESGDIIAALFNATTAANKKAKNITINLTADGAYTISAPIVAANDLAINGNGAIIDASGNAGDFITLNGSTEFVKKADETDSDHYGIDAVAINGVTINGLKGALITDAQKTLVKELTVANSVVEMPAAGKNVLNFNGKGYAGKVVVKNSTIYANGNNTGFFAQYGSRPKNINGDWLQEFDVQNSTIVNIAVGKNVCDMKQNGTAQNVYTLKNNIFVNVGKSGQVVVGFNKGQTSPTPVWDVDGNVFNYDGADKSAAEVEKAGQKNEEDIVKNSIAGIVEFEDAATGKFNVTLGVPKAIVGVTVGDPRWTVAAQAVPWDIVVNDADITEGNLTAGIAAKTEGVTVKSLTINLAKDKAYTVSAPIETGVNLTISGNGATIDASGLEGDFITLNGSTEFVKKADETDSDHYGIDAVAINGVTINGLKGALITDAQKTLVKELTVANSVVEMPAAGKNVLNFNGKGYAGKVVVKNSTIYANGNNTGFFAQYGSRPKNINGDWLQEFDVQNSTIVNIAVGKNVCDMKQNGTAQNVYTLKNNIFVNVGKSGQVVVGFNKGQTSPTPVWDVDGNVFNYDGADKSAAEVEKAGQKNEEDIVKNNVVGVITFTDAANGDFNGNVLLPFGATTPAALGDNRWTITYTNAPEKLYIIGDMNSWERTALIEMTFNAETNAFEYEFAPDKITYFAFATKQQTAEEAEADPDWDDFNANYRYSIGDSDNEAELNKALALVKGAFNGTIKVNPVKEGTNYKISVAWDLSTVTIAGEAAPEPEPVSVDKLFIMGNGTTGGWDATTEMTFNEQAQAFEYTLEVPANGAWFTFSDAEFDGNWDDFSANHRYALGAGDVDATIGETLSLVKVNGTLAIKTAGTYKISVAKDLSTVTITAVGTGINGIAADKLENATIYTISGQRVEKAQKGLYIINGKKVVIK